MGVRVGDARLPPMNRNLVIVESPAKAKTIERYLGPGYTVLASYGHVRDLPENPGKNQFGVDVEHDFAPVYEVVADRKKQLSAIQKAAAKADMVYLATDLDRVRTDEPRMAPDEPQVLSLVQPLAEVVYGLADDAVLARLDRRHVDGDGATDVDPIHRGTPRDVV